MSAWWRRSARRTRWLLAAAGTGLLGLVSFVDYITGYESLFFIFYFLPVALLAWFVGRRAGWAMAIASGMAWWIVDRAGGHPYPHEWYRIWNAFTCYVAFALMGYFVCEIRQQLDKQRRLNHALAESHDALQRSTQEIRKLQSQIQTVCAWTKRIRVDGQWVSFEDFLLGQLGIFVTHGLSEEAADDLRRQLRAHENAGQGPAAGPQPDRDDAIGEHRR
jgi:hypothetical protein